MGPVAAGAGVFAVSAATLMYEILLTRIFSVTMWYHFAFLAVAAALLGMTAGALLVQSRPATFHPAATAGWLAVSALAFAIGIPITFLLHLAIPFAPTLTFPGIASVLVTFGLVSIPFLFGGVTICLALTRLDAPVGTIYAADLAGAAAGCLLTVVVLRVADAPAAVFAVAAVAALGAAIFAAAARRRRLAVAAALVVALALLVVGARPGWLHITWVKGGIEAGPTLHERWNSYSRIRISGDPTVASPPFGWGLSLRYPAGHRVPQLLLSIDAVADTVLTGFDGNLEQIEHLRWDVTNFAHELRRDARVLVVGAGGGRDVLSALAFGQRQVLAVEVNEAILEAVNRRFGDYTGHLDRHPAVRFVNDEARSHVARLDERFEVIQLSFIDTFAASAAGAYVLTEHALYTVEAWRVFLDRLAPAGILTHSRWYFHRAPAEIHRLVALATASLLDSGVARPREHLILVRAPVGADPRYREAIGVGTLLVGQRPFLADDVALARAAAARLGFELVLDPAGSTDPVLQALTDPESFAAAVAASPLDIAAPTDDRPFFFHMVPLGRALRLAPVDQGNVSFNAAAVIVLVGALGVVALVTGACFALPLLRGRAAPGEVAARAWPGVFFAAIGLGYILVEISQLQRLSVFLGHPTHGLVVVLFALLLSSGAGSFAVRRPPGAPGLLAGARPLVALPAVLALFGAVTPALVAHGRGLPTPFRILLALAILTPIGFAMGTAFPRGLQLATRRTSVGAPWLWAVNGAASVLGSLLAVVVSISVGVSVTLWLGVAMYVGAAALGLRMAREGP